MSVYSRAAMCLPTSTRTFSLILLFYLYLQRGCEVGILPFLCQSKGPRYDGVATSVSHLSVICLSVGVLLLS